ncbi:hypothetical protein ACQWU4_06155 [Chryseobacterium sp. MIQD13]|uniref:hypothetical protein n=1 Tax=Chryseobacterium sp. MIQD13 TaxID=3422310 RepID=UPI003D2B7F54
MADWGSLKSLKTHSRILSWVILGLILVLFLAPKHFWENNLQKNTISSSAKVTAKRGASIRDIPSKNGNVLIVAPVNSEVEIIQRKVKKDTVDNKQGSWIKIQYQGKTGYVWEYLLD